MVTQAAEQYSLDQLAEEFVRRYREGERPSIAEYVAQYPQLAEEIEQLFPMLAVFEQAGPGSSSLLGACPEVVQAATSVPSQLGDYRILRCIGRGGMGIVYEAIQEPLGRHVALKVLSGNHLANPVLMERFRIEARAAASLHHTNIVPVFDVGEENGTHYYAMQYIQGQSLYAVILELRRLEKTPLARHLPDDEEADNTARTIAQGLISGQVAAPRPIADATTEPGPPSVSLFEVPTVPDVPATPPGATAAVVATDSVTSSDLNTQSRGQYFRRVASIGIQVAEALAYAHERGIVHRDVKPSNLLLDVQGRVWVTDFGLAKAEGSGELTRTGDFVGTLRYMAPERFKGKSDAVSDVYSLGVTLYELATRQPAFGGTNEAQLLLNIAKEDPPRPRQRDGRVPRDLETIIVKAMDKLPGRRYGTAVELAADLRRFTEDKPIRARRTTRPERLWRWSRRNPALASLVALITFVAVVGLPGVTWLWRNSETSRQAEIAAKGELETTLYFNRIALADREIAASDYLQALELLKKCPERLRQWEWEFLRRRWVVDPLVIHDPDKSELQCVAFHPGGKFFATGDADGALKIWNAASGQVVSKSQAHDGRVFGVTYSPDHRRLATAGADNAVKVWDVQTEAPQLIYSRPGNDGWNYGTTNAVAFSPNGKRLAHGDKSGSLIIRDAATGEELVRCARRGGIVSSVAFSGDGQFVATGSWDGAVRVWDSHTGALVRGQSYECLHPISGVAFSHDTKNLFASCFDHVIWTWNLASGKARQMRGHLHLVLGAALSPDGHRFASASIDQTIRLWDTDTYQQVLCLRGHTDQATDVAFSPDPQGHRLVSIDRDGTIRIWDATPLAKVGQQRLNLTGHTTEVWQAVFNSDGTRIASASSDKTVHIWNAQTGTAKYVFRRHPRGVFAVACSPDGQRIASVSTDARDNHAGQLLVWDAATGKVFFERKCDAMYMSVAFSPDGKYVVAGGDGHVIDFWDAKTGRYVAGLASDRGVENAVLLFSEDGTRLAVATHSNLITVWDIKDITSPVKLIQKQAAASHGKCGALSPDGRWVAAGGENNTVVVWDVDNGEVAYTLSGHTANIWALAFSPDGKRIASGGADCRIKVWDASTGEEIQTLRGHTGPVASLAFNHDGKQLVSASRRDNTVKVWDVKP